MLNRSKLAASFIAAIAFTQPALSADLYGEAPRYDYDQSYDEDQNGGYDRGYDRRDEPYYGDRYGSTKDGQYLEPPTQPPRFSEDRDYGRDGCTPRWQVRKQLQYAGWRNFERLAVRRNVVIIRAERPDGRAFDLKLDRCSGAVLAERPARFRGYGAYGPGPRRYGWAY